MAFRSFYIRVANGGPDLSSTTNGLNHGIWTRVPPGYIPSRHRDEFGSESDGVGTGTAGYAIYNSPAGDIGFYWNNPTIGSNSFRVDRPPGINISWGDISGNEANVTVTITDF